ncbi:hypothetical protein EFP07_16325 [Lactiplantibacillus plantarum]|uniref:hypothetical protein n=1 Tax=Lactiplantibacillus plantarum TaxID=1590 RepID=UPI000B3CA61A|nr:hypothetical protein [Lactiplantibacillus plantarum]MCT3263083.1 hypothetical protein [Lactiplantibacillus plantarum]OUT04192.1 LexA repressor [Lactiplantibacillus plantarum]
MVNEQGLIAAIRLHAPSNLPGPVSIDGLLSELGINDESLLTNALKSLQDKGYLQFGYGNGKIKRISLNTSFPL